MCMPIAILSSYGMPLPGWYRSRIALDPKSVKWNKSLLVRCGEGTFTSQGITWHSWRYLRVMLDTPAFPCSTRASCSRLPAHTRPFSSTSSTLPYDPTPSCLPVGRTSGSTNCCSSGLPWKACRLPVISARRRKITVSGVGAGENFGQEV